jgi:hypothetical protein
MEEVMERTVPRIEQMRDMSVVEWALTQLSGARMVDDEERIAELERLFPVPVARYWLESRNQVLAPRVMEELPMAVVAEVAAEYEARFLELDEPLARQFLLRLADLAPLRALSLLEEVVARAAGPKDALTLAFAVQATRRIGSPANALLNSVIDLCTGDGQAYHLYWSGLFGAMARVRRPTLAQDVVQALVATDGPGIEGQAILLEVFGAMAPECPFLEMLFCIEFQHSGYRFGDLPELFRQEAPIEELDRLAESLGDTRTDVVLKRLPQVGPDNGVANFARSLVDQLPPHAPKRVRRLVYLTVIAAAAAQYLCYCESWPELPYEQLVDIVTADVPFLPHENELLAHVVRSTGPRELERLHREVAVAREYRGAQRLVRVLCELHHESSIPALLSCLDGETDEAAALLAVVALARYGKAILQPLAGAWEEMDEVARMRALDVLGMAGSPEAADHLLHFFADVVDDELPLGAWCEAAQAIPDRRYLSLLDAPRHKRKAEVKQTIDRLKVLVA